LYLEIYFLQIVIYALAHYILINTQNIILILYLYILFYWIVIYIFILYLQTDDNIDSPAGSRRSSEQVSLIMDSIISFVILPNIRFFLFKILD
jgi:hypothetical protein